MPSIILFDVNETLLDLEHVLPVFDERFGRTDLAGEWFDVLLHSSLVVTLTSNYSNFGTLAEAALEAITTRHGMASTAEDRKALVQAMQTLPPHPDVRASLERLKNHGFRLATLTNSPPHVLSAQMDHTGLETLFDALLSVDMVERFKPAPEPYHAAAEELNVTPEEIRFVAAHDWDTAGALHAGCKAAYIDRKDQVYNSAYPKPTISGTDLTAVTDQILGIDG